MSKTRPPGPHSSLSREGSTNESLPPYSELDDEWTADVAHGIYKSPLSDEGSDQRLIFDESIRDGVISADVTFKSIKKQTEVQERIVGSLVFRFSDPKNFYYAGMGGVASRFFIGRAYRGEWQILESRGASKSIKRDHTYRIEVRCHGNRITLVHNGVPQLSVLDNSLNSGAWGLLSFGCSAEFKNIKRDRVNPRCFVIMPFSDEFKEVYEVIRETVESHDYDCTRADERYLTGPIIDDVTDQIEKADLIVADFTGKNPNVFFEAGYAAAIKKPLIQIAQSVSDLPFDVKHLRTFSYNTKILGDRRLAHDLGEAIKAMTGFGFRASARNGHESTDE